MCGIHGFNWSDRAQVQEMIAISRHRGPDGEGEYIDNQVSLGHNLLAITEEADISKQPWEISDKYVLCYNGEIYNYKELRSELKQFFSFKTDSDTEVLARGIEKYGVDFIHKIDGMYGISLYDKKERTLTLARDCSGVKPVYYTQIESKNKIAFSSSLKSLISLGLPESRTLDLLAFQIYMEMGYVPGYRTLISGIRKLYPGQVIKFDLDTAKVIQNFNTHKKIERNDNFSPEEFREQVSSTVKKCLMGRRPIGLFLSGGLDSTMILHELVRYDNSPKTFTTRFSCDASEERKVNSDADAAKRLATEYGTQHTELCITKGDFFGAIEPCIDALEEPRYNRSSPAYYLLNEEMSRQGIVVTLAGDGGDEILTGYPRHLEFISSSLGGDMCKSLPINSSESPSFQDLKLAERYYKLVTKKSRPLVHDGIFKFLKQDIFSYFNEWIPFNCFSGVLLNDELFIETLMQLPEDYLIRNDKLGMFFSMEGRFPLTTNSFKKYALSVSPKHKISGETKEMPRQSYKNHLPNYIINKEKTGWAIPPSWISSQKFQKRWKNNIFSKGYHDDTNCLFKLGSLKGTKDKRAIMTALYFRIWAQKFKITV